MSDESEHNIQPLLLIPPAPLRSTAGIIFPRRSLRERNTRYTSTSAGAITIYGITTVVNITAAPSFNIENNRENKGGDPRYEPFPRKSRPIACCYDIISDFVGQWQGVMKLGERWRGLGFF